MRMREGTLPVLFPAGPPLGAKSVFREVCGLMGWSGPWEILTANGPQPGDDAGACGGAGPIGSFPLVQGWRGLDCDLVLKACKTETSLSKRFHGSPEQFPLQKSSSL